MNQQSHSRCDGFLGRLVAKKKLSELIVELHCSLPAARCYFYKTSWMKKRAAHWPHTWKTKWVSVRVRAGSDIMPTRHLRIAHTVAPTGLSSAFGTDDFTITSLTLKPTCPLLCGIVVRAAYALLYFAFRYSIICFGFGPHMFVS